MSGTAWIITDERRTVLPAGWEPLTGHRSGEAWTWRLMDKQDRFLGLLDGVESGNLSWNVNADTRGTGSLTWTGLAGEQPDWRNTRVQPVYSATLMGDVLVEWPMGVYLCSTPADEHGDGFVSTGVQLYDKTLILRRAKVTRTSSVLAGTNVVNHVRSVLDVQYGGRHAIEDSSATLRSDMVFEPGTSWLTIVNALLDAIGYFSLAADGTGVLRSEPYSRPQDRPLVYDFADGVRAIYEPQFRHTRDDFDTVNRVSLVSRADGDTRALRSSITLDDIAPGHPLSWGVTGEWVDRVETDVEASSQAVLDAHAERLLRESLATASDIELTHAPVPLSLLDRVRFSRVLPSGVLALDAVVQTVDVPCRPGVDGFWTTHVREVAA